MDQATHTIHIPEDSLPDPVPLSDEGGDIDVIDIVRECGPGVEVVKHDLRPDLSIPNNRVVQIG